MPELVRTPDELNEALGGASDRPSADLALVPTMGALHEGHLTLIRRAKAQHWRVAVSIFVNPLQFGANEDLARYPRDLAGDLALAGSAGADLVFHPSPETMYPEGFDTRVEVGDLGARFEGASRPGHFSGVATVVLKLLGLVRPQAAYFGEKDWQQLAVVRRMVSDLNVPVTVVGVPTVRESSGLARSSRNRYLSPEQRERASVLFRAMRAMQQAYGAGEREATRLRQVGLEVLSGEPELSLDHLDVVNARLEPLALVQNDVKTRILIAARLWGVRLIDNAPLEPQAG